MRLLATLGVGILAMLVSEPLQAATIVHVDGVANSSNDGSNAANVTLPAGTYVLTFSTAAGNAFSRFPSSANCDANGSNCQQGYETSVVYNIGGTLRVLGAGGGLGPIDPGDGYYDTPQRALANAGAFSATITLTQATTVGFFLGDDYTGDNRGSVDISIVAQQSSTAYSYDALGRLTGVNTSGGSADGTASSYAYDKAGNRTNVHVSRPN